MLSTWDEVSYRLLCPRPGWRNSSLLAYWDDITDDGRLADTEPNYPSGAYQTHLCALALHAQLAAGESVELPFILAWHFPNRTVTGCGWSGEAAEQNWLGNHYTERFADAWEAAHYTARNLADLEEKSSRYVRSMLSSTLPDFVLDAAMSNVSTLRTQTCMRTADGEFHAFEGCAPRHGCCAGTCTHVWNYEQATAFLFPTLTRSMRNTEFLNDTDERGLMRYRTVLPLGTGQGGTAVADGQMGTIMRLHRDWQLSGDTQWLRKLWPQAKKALEFAWITGGWDGNRDGVMEGVQHNTYDIEYHGPTPQTGFWYLGALRAAEEMAGAVGDDEAADCYQKLFTSGSSWWDKHGFNGEYYFQDIRPQPSEQVAPGLIIPDTLVGDVTLTGEPIHQTGPGCLADQLVGQWFAHTSDLGYLLEPEHVRRTLQAIFRYNYKRTLSEHSNVARTYALGDEAGLVIGTWPHGERPELPFHFFCEVWTGFEYMLAASLIYEQMIDPALEIVRSTRERHDGEKRNPWDEPECGHHYARAMAAWSLILALSGFHYSAVDKSMCFAPKVNTDDFRCFWSVPTAWGSYAHHSSENGLNAWLSVEYGEIALNRLELQAAPNVEPEVIEFPKSLQLGAGDSFTIGGQ